MEMNIWDWLPTSRDPTWADFSGSYQMVAWVSPQSSMGRFQFSIGTGDFRSSGFPHPSTNIFFFHKLGSRQDRWKPCTGSAQEAPSLRWAFFILIWTRVTTKSLKGWRHIRESRLLCRRKVTIQTLCGDFCLKEQFRTKLRYLETVYATFSSPHNPSSAEIGGHDGTLAVCFPILFRQETYGNPFVSERTD